MKNILFTLALFQATTLYAQKDSLKKWTFSGYGEVYYSYDFAKPQNHKKEDFIYNHKQHNEINANLIIAKAMYADKNSRANMALMAGNYPQYNLSSEPTWAQFIYEANIGIRLSQKHNLWLDAGIMPSHIGFEGAVSADCWTLTRSILAENSPYYEAGAKLSFINKKENLNIAFLALNGWQRISKPDYIQQPSFGLQVNYKPINNLILNYSNFIGTAKPDSLNALRTFHNFYLQYEPKGKLGLIAGFDIGTDKYNAKNYGIWFSPVLIIRYTLNNTIKMALRGEYYNDKKQIIIATKTANGFQVSGLSANVDYKINEILTLRMEGKMYHSEDKIFQNNATENYSWTTNMCIKL